MKKTLFIVLASMLFVTGCGTSATPLKNENVAETEVVVNDNRSNVSEEKSEEGAIEAENVLEESVTDVRDEDFSIKEYKYENSIGDTLYYLAVTNHSNLDVEIYGNGIAKDSDGNVLGADDMSIDIVGAGETSIGYFYFDGVTDVDTVEYQLTYGTSPFYYPVVGQLSVEQNLNDKNLTISLTNNGAMVAQFVEAYALFLDADGKVLNCDSTYITDGESEIKPGATIAGQLDCYKGYDHVDLYLTGRSNGDKTEGNSTAGKVSDGDFEIAEYLYSNSIGDSVYYLIVKSNASVPVEINGNAVAKDADGNTIGADNMEIDIIGPGETSIGYFYFDSVSGIDKVEYQLSYNTSPYYRPVIGDLEIEENINSKNIVITVTNKGSEAAQFVEAYALFFDANNQVIHTDSTYVTDNDSEIKPGATLSAQMDSYGLFDHAEVYFTGRK